MNIKLHRNNFFRRARIFAALLAGIFLIHTTSAQMEEQPVKPKGPGRFLFIFDTSSAMRSRVEAVKTALNAIFVSSLKGELHSGDSVGAWTFSQDLQAGNFPLQTWNPDNAVAIAASFTRYVGDQHYAKTARFEALQPLLNQVVQGSEQLTVLIVCDGSVKMSGTPYDAGINQAFAQKLGDQNKAHEPFIVVLRSQLGKFTGCAMTFPPAPINLPEFPPLPAPPAPSTQPAPPAPKTANLPPPVVISNVPSLFITGTNVSTNPPSETISAPASPPAPAIISPATNSTIQLPNVADAPPSNQAVIKNILPPPTNAPAATLKDPGFSGKNFLAVGAGLLGAALVIGIAVRLRSHRKDTSLITRSMNDRR